MLLGTGCIYGLSTSVFDSQSGIQLDMWTSTKRQGSLLLSLDLQVTREQIFTDLATPKFEWDHPGRSKQPQKTDAVTVSDDPYGACNDAHGLAVLTEWDEFKKYDYERIYNTMMKPAFIFDGRNLLDHDKLREIGFIVYALGKPLDPFIQKAYS